MDTQNRGMCEEVNVGGGALAWQEAREASKREPMLAQKEMKTFESTPQPRRQSETRGMRKCGTALEDSSGKGKGQKYGRRQVGGGGRQAAEGTPGVRLPRWCL